MYEEICSEINKIFNINYQKEIGSYDYNLLMDERINSAELAFIIKKIANRYWSCIHNVKHEFVGEVTINNIIKCASG